MPQGSTRNIWGEPRNPLHLVNHTSIYRSNSFIRYVASFTAMDLRQLHALLAVAEHRSFSAAARALHTVQSNVSTHVARLEQEVGATLIERSRGDLTHEGEVVAARARRILAPPTGAALPRPGARVRSSSSSSRRQSSR